MKYDLFLVGVGGQGILTIGEILSTVAEKQGIPVSFYPSKGMAQRGGSVKAQLRFGQEPVGPIIREAGADLVIAMELSESLKAIRYVKTSGDFVLFGDTWATTGVLLKKDHYPTAEAVCERVQAAGANLLYINPESLLSCRVESKASNLFILGVAMGYTTLGNAFDPIDVDQVIQARWKRSAEQNHDAFQAGLHFQSVTKVMEN